MRKQPHPPSWAMNLRTSSRELSGYSIANEPSACLLGVAAVEASALPASLVPLNLVGLRTKLFMEFNLGRNSALALQGLGFPLPKLKFTRTPFYPAEHNSRSPSPSSSTSLRRRDHLQQKRDMLDFLLNTCSSLYNCAIIQ